MSGGRRVALVHDWLTGMRGGEKCLEALLAVFPEADIHTLLHIPGSVSQSIEARPIRTSFIGRLPGAARHYRHYLPLFPRAVESLDLAGYDLVVSLSHCVAKGALVPPSASHVCYCFTPMRYAWDQYHAYLARMNWPTRSGMRLFMGYLRAWDLATAGRPDRYLTISRFVAERIRRCYGREAEVIYPPVETDFFTPSPSPAEGGYYLVVSALVPYKCLDLVVRAAPALPHPVVIAGCGPEEARLRSLARGNVEFTGWLSREELRQTYRDCRAFLFPGEEDFGLTPVEAMACGRPVIGYARGGWGRASCRSGVATTPRPPASCSTARIRRPWPPRSVASRSRAAGSTPAPAVGGPWSSPRSASMPRCARPSSGFAGRRRPAGKPGAFLI